MTKSTLSRLSKIFAGDAAAPAAAAAEEKTMATKADDVQDGLTLEDRQLIGIIETIDRRVASLEHDVWVIRGKIAALGQGGDQPE